MFQSLWLQCPKEVHTAQHQHLLLRVWLSGNLSEMSATKCHFLLKPFSLGMMHNIIKLTRIVQLCAVIICSPKDSWKYIFFMILPSEMNLRTFSSDTICKSVFGKEREFLVFGFFCPEIHNRLRMHLYFSLASWRFKKLHSQVAKKTCVKILHFFTAFFTVLILPDN